MGALHTTKAVLRVDVGRVAPPWVFGSITAKKLRNFICKPYILGNIYAIIGPQNGPILLC